MTNIVCWLENFAFFNFWLKSSTPAHLFKQLIIVTKQPTIVSYKHYNTINDVLIVK